MNKACKVWIFWFYRRKNIDKLFFIVLGGKVDPEVCQNIEDFLLDQLAKNNKVSAEKSQTYQELTQFIIHANS